nr:hypothetical protein [Tanacetum cinerariifolium]
MDLLAFIHHADPTKVRIREREVREGEVSPLELTRGRVVSLAGVNDQGNQNKVVDEARNQNEGVLLMKRRREVDGANGSNHPPKKLRADHGTSGNIGVSTGGKSLAAIQELFEPSTLNVDVGVTVAATEPFVTSSVTLTQEREGGGPTDSITRPNLRTQKPAQRFVISSDSSHDSNANAVDDGVNSVVRSSILDPAILTTVVATTVVANTSAPVPRVGPEP